MNFFSKSIQILDSKLIRLSVILLLMMIISMVLETLSISLIIPVLSILLDDNLLSKYQITKDILIYFNNPSREDLIIGVMGIIVFVFLTKAAYLVLFNWRQAKFIYYIQTFVSKKLFSGYIFQPYSFHTKRNSSSLIRNIVTEVNTLTSCYTALIILITEILVFIGIGTLLVMYEPIGSLITILIFSLSGTTFYLLFRNKIALWGNLRQGFDEKKIQYIQEGLGGIKESKIYGKELNFISQFFNQIVGSSEMGKRINFLSTFPRLFLELLIISAMSIFVIYLVTNLTPPENIIATLGLFAVAAFRLLPSVSKIIGSVQLLRYNSPVINLIHKELKILDETSQRNKYFDTLNFSKEIVLENVKFNYNKNERVLDDINLIVNKGEKIGLIGETGSGKSTLIDLILGLIEPLNGSINVDGVNINKNIQGWQRNIGYVPQTIFLSDDTLRNNIAFGIKEDEIDESRVSEALASSQLDTFVSSLEDGVNTKVGERGVRLSGGQRQRIGIARALYNNPNLLVFDEATSSLDYETENEIISTINILKNKTIIIIAHRLNTLKHCNAIYELSLGRLQKKDFDDLNIESNN